MGSKRIPGIPCRSEGAGAEWLSWNTQKGKSINLAVAKEYKSPGPGRGGE